MIEQLPPPSIEAFSHNAERVINTLHEKFARMTPAINELLEARHAIFSLPPASVETPAGTPFDPELPLADQLYPEPSYNAGFLYTDLGLRGQGAAEFHNEREKYGSLPTDNSELLAKKAAYRRAILAAGQSLGFVGHYHGGEPRTPIDKQLGIENSELVPIDTPVEAVIIPAAAGLTNAKRLRDTIRNIESGAIKTNRIIFATCDRPVNLAERGRSMAGGFRAGTTEYQSVRFVAEQLLGVMFEPEHLKPVSYGHDLYAKKIDAQTIIGETPVDFSIVSAPFDPERIVGDRPADRANTEETFYAITDLLSPGDGLLVIESHDTWVPSQALMGEKVFGLTLGKDVIGTGPYNSDRLIEKDGHLDIVNAEGVVDEIAKTYSFLTSILIAAENQRQAN